MTDIVERLRDLNSIYPTDLLRKEAAEEIERLQADKARLSQMSSYRLHEIVRLQAEVEQLRMLLEEISAEAGVTTSSMATEVQSKQRIIDLAMKRRMVLAEGK